ASAARVAPTWPWCSSDFVAAARRGERAPFSRVCSGRSLDRLLGFLFFGSVSLLLLVFGSVSFLLLFFGFVSFLLLVAPGTEFVPGSWVRLFLVLFFLGFGCPR